MTDTSGPTSQTPFAFYDPDTRSLRTSQGTFPWDSTPCSPTLPRSGSMRNGALFERPTLALPTDASACSSLLGTPNARDWKGSPGPASNYVSLPKQIKNLTGSAHPTSGFPCGADTLLPTPAANDSGNTPGQHLRKKPGREVVASLQIIVDHDLLQTGGRLLPTPNTMDGMATRSDEALARARTKGGCSNLKDVVPRLLPTPTVGDSRNSRNSTAGRSKLPPSRPTADLDGLGDTLCDIIWKMSGKPLPELPT